MATQQDVARRARVSYMTVSRVINNKPNVNKETRARVLEAIKELSYYPNTAAQTLSGSPTNNVGIIFPEKEFILTRPYFIELSVELEQNLSVNGYHLFLGSIRTEGDEQELHQLIAEKRVDGLIIFAPPQDDPRITLLARKNVPFTIIHGQSNIPNSSCVNSDIKQGITLLLDHLTGLGHTNIGFVSVNLKEDDARQRLQTYRSYCQSKGLNCSADMIYFEGDWTLESGYNAFKKFCREKKIPTAIIFSNDQMAVGAIKAAHDIGINIPRDISIVGIDDIKYASFIVPSLTTIRYSIPQIARTAVEQILTNIEHGNKHDHAVFPRN